MAITNAVLRGNIITVLEDISSLFVNVDRVNTRARTVYYKAIFVSMASVVEALVYHLIERHCEINPSLSNETEFIRYIDIQPINKISLGTDKDIVVAQKVKKPFMLDNANSQVMNIFCRDKVIIGISLFDKLEYVRHKRNQIHLQTLDTTSRSYTSVMVEKAATAGSLLLDKISELEVTASTA